MALVPKEGRLTAMVSKKAIHDLTIQDNYENLTTTAPIFIRISKVLVLVAISTKTP
jgi:hypothetical protein